jgi:hypothetical protein
MTNKRKEGNAGGSGSSNNKMKTGRSGSRFSLRNLLTSTNLLTGVGYNNANNNGPMSSAAMSVGAGLFGSSKDTSYSKRRHCKLKYNYLHASMLASMSLI